MEGLHAVTTEEISRPKVDLCCEVTARSSREEESARLRKELGKMGSEMLENSELQRRGSALLATQQALKEMRQRAEGTDVP